MAKSIKIWSGSEWTDLAIIAPTISGLATASSLSEHAADTTNIHGISDTANLVYTNDLSLKAPINSPSFTGTVSIENSITTSSTSFNLINSNATTINFAGAATTLNIGGGSTRLKLTAGSVLESPISRNVQVASYSLALSDAGRLIEMNVGSANNLTVPLNSSVAFPIGTKIDILQTGTGQTTIVSTSGVTINSNSTLKLSGQWSAATLIKRAEDTWILIGNLE